MVRRKLERREVGAEGCRGMGADALRMDPGNEQEITEKKTDNFLT